MIVITGMGVMMIVIICVLFVATGVIDIVLNFGNDDEGEPPCYL